MVKPKKCTISKCKQYAQYGKVAMTPVYCDDHKSTNGPNVDVLSRYCSECNILCKYESCKQHPSASVIFVTESLNISTDAGDKSITDDMKEMSIQFTPSNTPVVKPVTDATNEPIEQAPTTLQLTEPMVSVNVDIPISVANTALLTPIDPVYNIEDTVIPITPEEVQDKIELKVDISASTSVSPRPTQRELDADIDYLKSIDNEIASIDNMDNTMDNIELDQNQSGIFADSMQLGSRSSGMSSLLAELMSGGNDSCNCEETSTKLDTIITKLDRLERLDLSKLDKLDILDNLNKLDKLNKLDNLDKLENNINSLRDVEFAQLQENYQALLKAYNNLKVTSSGGSKIEYVDNPELLRDIVELKSKNAQLLNEISDVRSIVTDGEYIKFTVAGANVILTEDTIHDSEKNSVGAVYDIVSKNGKLNRKNIEVTMHKWNYNVIFVNIIESESFNRIHPNVNISKTDNILEMYFVYKK